MNTSAISFMDKSWCVKLCASRVSGKIAAAITLLWMLLFFGTSSASPATTTVQGPWSTWGAPLYHNQCPLMYGESAMQSCVQAQLLVAFTNDPFHIPNGWTSNSIPCEGFDDSSLECSVAAVSDGNTEYTARIDLNCSNGGQPKTEGGLLYSSYCLTQVMPQRNSGCKGCLLGNPINVAAGNKYEPVTDYRGGGAFPLVFSRAYNSILSGQSNENMGSGWSTSIGEHLQVDPRTQLVVCQELNSPYRYFLCPNRIDYDAPIEITVWGADGSQSLFTYQYNTAPDGTQLVTEQTSTGQLFFMAALPAPASGSG